MAKKELYEVFSHKGIQIRDGKYNADSADKDGKKEKKEEKSEIKPEPVPTVESVIEPVASPVPTVAVETPAPSSPPVAVSPPVQTQLPITPIVPAVTPAPAAVENTPALDEAPQPVAAPAATISSAPTSSAPPAPKAPKASKAETGESKTIHLEMSHLNIIIAGVVVLLFGVITYMIGFSSGQKSPIKSESHRDAISPVNSLRVSNGQGRPIRVNTPTRKPVRTSKATKPKPKPKSKPKSFKPPKGAFTMQLVTYNNTKKWRERCAEMVNILKKNGFDAYTIKTRSGKIVLFTGNYESKSSSRLKADKAALESLKVGRKYPFKSQKPWVKKVK